MTSKFNKTADAVADDRNWIALIKNEFKCADVWYSDWGFLAAGGETDNLKEKATKIYTIEDKIRMVEEVNLH